MYNVEKHFGGVRAIDNFSLKLEPGQIHGLIGPNGAGKTTIFNNITGIYAPSAGKIIFNGQFLIIIMQATIIFIHKLNQKFIHLFFTLITSRMLI